LSVSWPTANDTGTGEDEADWLSQVAVAVLVPPL